MKPRLVSDQRQRAIEAERRYRAKDPERYRAIQREQSRRARERRTPEQRQRILERQREYDRARREDPVIRERYRAARIAWAYGITADEHSALLSQGCAICGGAATALDHDHITNVIRAALCTKCNAGLGMFADDPARLEAAADYLRHHAND